MSLAHQDLETPIGRYRISASEAGLLQLAPLDEPTEPTRRAGARPPASAPARRHLHAAARALDDYFEGRRRAFDDLTLAAAGTPFQRRVWTALRRIPFGATRSYAALAGAIGRPGAARAVGRANGSNPLAILVPCHRVIGADGRLTGYAGGVWRKQWLLAHEEASAPGS